MSLPTSLDALTGRRAARWLRESTGRQFDKYGPEAQREQQDRAIERFGLVDTGIEWSVAHSGRTVAGTPTFADMMARAGTDYDVLVVGYVSRFARNLKHALIARDDMHLAGAAILFCDERLLSSDEDRWDEFVREAHEAESYSRKLGRRVHEAYDAKFRRFADPAGQPPLGFRRVDPGRVMAIDPDTIGQAVALFERYATGTVSIDELAAECGIAAEGLKDILKNPIYNGWVERRGVIPGTGKRSPTVQRQPAQWRAHPPVSDDLWSRVESIRERRRRGGGPRVPGRIDPLRGLVRCACGSSVRAVGMSKGKHRRRHTDPVPCPAGVERAYVTTETLVDVVAAQVTQIRHDDATMAAIVRALQVPDSPPVSIDRGRLARRRRQVVDDFAAKRIDMVAFTAALAELDAQEQEPDDDPAVVSPDRAVRWLRDIPALWAAATEEERAELIAAIYDEVTVRGTDIESVRLTPHAYAHGLALALPERVRVGSQWRARRALNTRMTLHVPVVGRAEWARAARRRSA